MSAKDERFDVDDWPEVPKEFRPMILPVCVKLVGAEITALELKGWVPKDIRVMPNDTVEQRRESVAYMLAAIRIGTAPVSTQRIRAIELEAKSLGLLGKEGTVEKKKGDVLDVLDALQNFSFTAKG